MADPITRRISKKIVGPAEKGLAQVVGPARAKAIAPAVAPMVARAVTKRVNKVRRVRKVNKLDANCLLYTSPSPRDS